MKNRKHFQNYFYLLGLKQNFDSLNDALKYVQQLDEMHYFDNRTQKMRMKDEVKTIIFV